MQVELLNSTHVKEIRQMEDNLRSMHSPSMVIASTLEEIIKCIVSEHSYGIFIAKRLIAYVLCYEDDYKFSAFIEKTNTLPSYRGNGYNHTLMQAVERSLKAGKTSFMVSMVSPLNEGSLSAFKKAGFSVHKKVRYQKENRIIVIKKLYDKN